MSTWGNMRMLINDSVTKNLLDETTNVPTLTTNHQEVLKSFNSYWNKNGGLTESQVRYLKSIKEHYESKASEDSWKASFDDSKRNRLNICASYYIKTLYFKDMAKKVIADPSWIPTEKQYRAMCENKYANHLIENYNIPPKYEIGSLIQLRSTYKGVLLYECGNSEKVATIVSTSVPMDPSAGSRLYSVIFIGCDTIQQVREKDIKNYRETK